MSITDFLLRKFLFRPVKLAQDYRFKFAQPFAEHWFDTADAVRLNALVFPTDVAPKRGVVLYFHGNRDNLQRWGAMHTAFTALGYDFCVPDYRGYGKSTGEPGETAYFNDAALMYKWLAEQYSPQNIVLYGRSLGTGMASYLAAHFPAQRLILETPFNNIPGLLASHLHREAPPFDPPLTFPNDVHLQQTTLPVLIFHGTRDRVVPYASAACLKAYLKPSDQFITIEGGSHNNLETYRVYREKLRAFLTEIEVISPLPGA